MQLDTPLIELTGTQEQLFRSLKALLREKPGKSRLRDRAFWQSIECHREIESMVEQLNRKSPPGYYFGSSPWDPLSLGYWRIDDA